MFFGIQKVEDIVPKLMSQVYSQTVMKKVNIQPLDGTYRVK